MLFTPELKSLLSVCFRANKLQAVNWQDLANAGCEFILLFNASSFLFVFKAVDSSNDCIPVEKGSSPLVTRSTYLDE